MDNILLTPAALLDVLSKVEELSQYDIGIDESDGKIQLVIGDSTYEIPTEQAEEIEVPEEVVDTVEEVNQEAMDTIEQSDEFTLYNDEETIEGGIIKALAKTLLVGGLVRLSANLIGKELKK